MKASGPCPRCTGTKLYAIEQALIPDPRYSNSLDPLTIVGAIMGTGEKGFLGEKEARMVVTLEVWVCAGCGYAELYAKELEILRRMAEQGVGGVRAVERDAALYR